MAGSEGGLPSISVTNAPKQEDHGPRRMFVGPMPEKVVSNVEAEARKHGLGLFHTKAGGDEAGADTDGVRHFMKEHAFQFFLRRGGKVEDWGEVEEQSTLEEMAERWRNSEWGSIWSRRRKRKNNGSAPGLNRQPSRWVGGSFEIGYMLGVNIHQEHTSPPQDRPGVAQLVDGEIIFPASTNSHVIGEGEEDVSGGTSQATSQSAQGPFIPSPSGGSAVPNGSVGGMSGQFSESLNSKQPLIHAQGAASTSSTSILQTRSSALLPSSPGVSSSSVDLPTPRQKGKGRQVRYEDEVIGHPPVALTQDQSTSSVALAGGSAVGSLTPPSSESTQPDNVVMRGIGLFNFAYGIYSNSFER